MPNRLYVVNLPYSFTSADLQQLFSEYGVVRSAHVVTDRESGHSRGFGFVEMETPEAFRGALSGADGRKVDGRGLQVTEARERPPREAGPRSRDGARRSDERSGPGRRAVPEGRPDRDDADAEGSGWRRRFEDLGDEDLG
jgi:RNA recognition motif-containing protein